MNFTYQYNRFETPVEWDDGQFTSQRLRSPDYIDRLAEGIFAALMLIGTLYDVIFVQWPTYKDQDDKLSENEKSPLILHEKPIVAPKDECKRFVCTDARLSFVSLVCSFHLS